MNPKVSIIIPTRNRVVLLKETLESIFNQTYDDWEVVVVDDASDDGTLEYLDKLASQEPRLQFVRNDVVRRGATVCRNKGVRMSKGSYLIFLDSDDLLMPWTLEERVRIMDDHPDLDFAAFLGEIFDKTPGDVGLVGNMPIDRPELVRILGNDVPWGGTGPIWRKESFLRIGGWDESITFAQDIVLNTRALAMNLKYRYYPKVDRAIRRGGDRKTIGGDTPSLEGIEALANAIVGYIPLLEGKMTKQIKILLAGQLLLQACRCLWFHRDKGAAFRIWKRAGEKNLCPRLHYWLGWLHIRWYRQLPGEVAVWALLKCADEDLFLTKRAVGKQLPKSCLEEDPYDGRYHRQPPFLESPAVDQGLIRFLFSRMIGWFRKKMGIQRKEGSDSRTV